MTDRPQQSLDVGGGEGNAVADVGPQSFDIGRRESDNPAGAGYRR